MKNVKEFSVSSRTKISSFLSKKPIWVSWISYSILSAIVFGIFYAAVYLVGFKWWITVVVILTAGITWGSLSYSRRIPADEEEVTLEE